jgi:polysaccharide chain length determinant protein (PEP-CTERM system associated)
MCWSCRNRGFDMAILPDSPRNQLQAIVERSLDMARGAWRFRWAALVLAWCLSLVGWIAVLCLPDRYEASARVFVDSRTALSRATEGLAMATDIDSQIDRVREGLLGGPRLEEVARKEGLQIAGATPTERQNVISRLREHIQISPRGGGLYVISYADTNRERSLRVVERILNRFVEDTLGGKREGSEQAQQFLQEQISQDEHRLAAAEDRLAQFKKKNVGLLPGAQRDYFSRLQDEMEALRKAQGDLAIAQRRRDELLRQTRGEPVLASGGATTNATPKIGALAGDSDIAARIRETQSRLDELLLKFTDKHPDVIALGDTLNELKARQQADIDAVRQGDAGAAARMGLGSNPVFQNVQLQLNQTDVEIAALRGQVNESQRRIANLKQLVDTAPEVEAEFARLNRDYEVTRTRYQALVQRLEQSRLSQQAEETGIVRFEVIDPPRAPFEPTAPKRPLLILAVLIAALAAGAGFAGVLHRLKPVFSNAQQLNQITGRPVLGVVSMTWVERHKARQRERAWIYTGAASLLIVVAGGLLLTQSHATHLLQHWVG